MIFISYKKSQNKIKAKIKPKSPDQAQISRFLEIYDRPEKERTEAHVILILSTPVALSLSEQISQIVNRNRVVTLLTGIDNADQV